MRLPIGTPQHERQEVARELHERLYAAFLGGTRIEVPVAEGQRPAEVWPRISGNLHRFWSERGFRLRGRSRGQVVEVWIERIDARKDSAA